jgi:hypothetical protein
MAFRIASFNRAAAKSTEQGAKVLGYFFFDGPYAAKLASLQPRTASVGQVTQLTAGFCVEEWNCGRWIDRLILDPYSGFRNWAEFIRRLQPASIIEAAFPEAGDHRVDLPQKRRHVRPQGLWPWQAQTRAVAPKKPEVWAVRTVVVCDEVKLARAISTLLKASPQPFHFCFRRKLREILLTVSNRFPVLVGQ